MLAPTGPAIGDFVGGATWSRANDGTLVDIVRQFVDVFRVDQNKVDETGFSRGVAARGACSALTRIFWIWTIPG